jgi:hypothetical protein
MGFHLLPVRAAAFSNEDLATTEEWAKCRIRSGVTRIPQYTLSGLDPKSQRFGGMSRLSRDHPEFSGGILPTLS